MKILLFIMFFVVVVTFAEAYQITFVSDKDLSKSERRIVALYDFYKGQKGHRTNFVALANLKKSFPIVSKSDFIFVVVSSPKEKELFRFDRGFIDFLDKYVSAGGRLVLIGDALCILKELALENQSVTKKLYAGEKETCIGVQALPEHSLFNEISPALYFDVLCEEGWAVGYFSDYIPNGQVIGVELVDFAINSANKYLLEYSKGKGRVLAVGILPNLDNYLLGEDLKRFFQNVLVYLRRAKNLNDVVWSYDKKGIYPFVSDLDNVRLDTAVFWTMFSKLSTRSYYSQNKVWNLAGKGLCCYGKDNAGIEVICSKFFRAIEEYETAIIFQDTDTIAYLKNFKPEIIYSPESFIRVYKIGRIFLREVITLSAEYPIAVIHYEYSGTQPIRLIVRFKTSLGFLPPFEKYIANNLLYSYNKDSNAFVVKDALEKKVLILASNKEFSKQTIGQYSDFRKYYSIYEGVRTEDFIVSGFIEFELLQKDALDISIVCSNEGIEPALRLLQRTKNCESVYRQAFQYYEENLKESLQFKSPNYWIDDGLLWSKVQLYKSLSWMDDVWILGNCNYKSGANENVFENEISGRLWSVIALVNIGDFDEAKKVLESILNFQKSTGLIPRNISNYGSLDIADYRTTAFLLIAIARYFKVSGDYSFVMQNWQKIALAIDILKNRLSEKSNDDYNFLYFSAIDEIAFVCDKLVKYEYLPSYKLEDVMNANIQGNGAKVENTTAILLPLYFNFFDEKTTDTLLMNYRRCDVFSKGGIIGTKVDDFSSKSPQVNLFYTGLSSIAEFSNLYSYFGYEKLVSMLRNFDVGVYKSFSTEPLQSGLNSLNLEEALFINAVVEGLLGIEFNAVDKAIKLSPHILPDVDTLRVNNIRIGKYNFNFSYLTVGDTVYFDFEWGSSDTLAVEFYPIFCAGTDIYYISSDKTECKLNKSVNSYSTVLQLFFNLSGKKRFAFEQANGISIIPLPFSSKILGDNYYQVIKTQLQDNQFIIDLEGTSGSIFTLDLSCKSNMIKSVVNGKVLASTPQRTTVEFAIPRSSKKFNKHRIIINL